MSLRARAWFLAAFAAIAVAYGPGCAAPVLPIPPPAQPIIEGPDENGIVTISGTAEPGAIVFCFNESTGAGVIVTADAVTGEFTLRLEAMSGDGLRLWQEVDGANGMPRDLTVP